MDAMKIEVTCEWWCQGDLGGRKNEKDGKDGE